MCEEKMPLKTLISSLIFRAFSMLKICAPRAQYLLRLLSSNVFARVTAGIDV